MLYVLNLMSFQNLDNISWSQSIMYFLILFSLYSNDLEADLERVWGDRDLPISCNHFEELQTVLFEVEVIINTAPLTYAYANTIETCLTPNCLLFGRHWLYCFNTASAVVRNLNVLSSSTDKINCISNHFCDGWRHEYIVNLCQTQRTSKLNMNSSTIMLR